MLDNLHLIRPWWLLALIPVGVLAWQVCRPRAGENPWQRIVDARLLPLLMIGPTTTSRRGVLGLVALGWLVATLALADPTWERKPQPVFQTGAARVVVLDLSSSMNATDLKPTRLARARYKVEDVLALGAEGQTGLVVYAGDAFTVTPLTRDVNTIRSQLNALAPDLMPSDGSRADLGLLKAEELLHQAGVSSGQVLLIADGIGPEALPATQRAAARLNRDGYRVSVLGINAAETAPSTAAASGSAHDAHEETVPIDVAGLRSIAQSGGGVDLSNDAGSENLRGWVDSHAPSQAVGTPASATTAQAWKENGPLLVLLLLPIAALAFRRNWLFSVMLLSLFAMQPHEAMAASWDDLWQRPEQQAARSLSAGDYAKAARLASDADRRGSAEYKRGNYPLALQDFSHASGPQADYNRGNALAKLARYPEAISAYDQALKVDPGNADARANKAAVEALLKQQQDQQKPPSQEQKPSQGSGSKKDAKSGASGQGGDQGSSADKGKAGKPGSGNGAQGTQGNAADRDKDGQASPAKAQSSGQANASQGGSPNGQASQAGAPNGQASPGAGKTASKADSKDAGGSERPEPAPASASASAPAPAPGGTGHEFADAARQLAEPGATEPRSQGSTAAGEPGAASASARSDAKGKQGTTAASGSAQPLPTEEQLAAEQWLRRIPDDPGGLLRRKFLYQYRQRAQQAPDHAQ